MPTLTIGASEQEILNERIARLLEVDRSSMKINSALVQVCDSVGYVKRALHIVSHDNAGYSKTLL